MTAPSVTNSEPPTESLADEDARLQVEAELHLADVSRRVDVLISEGVSDALGASLEILLDPKIENYSLEMRTANITAYVLGLIVNRDIERDANQSFAEREPTRSTVSHTDYGVAPGEYLVEWARENTLSPQNVANMLKWPMAEINDLVNGRTPITMGLAITLARLTSIPAVSWMRYEATYRADLERIEAANAAHPEP
jgi:plasmid maintenance system antidote protein VapI